MKTTVELIEESRESIESLLRKFLLAHTGLRKRNMSGPHHVVIGRSHSWTELDAQGRALQAKLFKEHRKLVSLVQALLRLAPESSRTAARNAAATLLSIIDQSGPTSASSTQVALDRALKALDEQSKRVKALHDPTAGVPLVVADASAVVSNPNLEEWVFDGVPQFSIVLTSTLLRELDELKTQHRNEAVREKAEGAIRRIKEYGRRGNIHEGVTLRRDRSDVLVTAAEPDFGSTLPWIDSSIEDDRLIAACIEIAREHVHSPVALVTRDINMRNKAVLAGIPFVEPPYMQADAASPSEIPSQRRRVPDLRILELNATGGSTGTVTFTALVQNYGSEPVRAYITATVNGELVAVQPSPLDLLVNSEPVQVFIDVPRPRVGDLVAEFNNETTLYAQELVLEVRVADQSVTSETWGERVYDPETNGVRHEIQQRYWRMGRGDDTEGDRRAAHIASWALRLENSEGRGADSD